MEATGRKCDSIHDEEGDRGKRIELANAYFFKGRKSLTKGNKDEALRLFRASTAIQEEVYGTYHKRTGRSYFFLAQILFKHTNDFDRALTAYRRALRVGISLDRDYNYVEGAKRAIRKLLFDKKEFDIDAVENFFSSVVGSVRLEREGIDHVSRNNYENALGSFEKCLAIEEKAEATFPLDLGHLHIRIAEVNRKQGEYGMAINAYRVALSIYDSALGRDYADSITCLRGIESCLYEMNLSDSVIQEYPESIFKSFHHCQKGIAYMKSNKFREAVNEYEAARLIEENSLGKYPLTASDIRKQLGLAFLSLQEYDRAILELRTALSINIFECGEDHKSVVVTLQDIRFVMEEKGYDFSSINKYMNTVAFSVKHERYGEHLLLEKQDFSGAIEEFQKSLALEVSALGKFHLTQGGLFKAIGDAFFQNTIFDFAVVNYRNALVVYQHVLGTEHDYTISALTSIGDATREIGLNTDEVDEYRKIVSESITIEKTAENLIKDGAEIEAIAAYRRAARKEGSLLGHHHLSTADLHGKIAKALKNMGRYDGAIVSYRHILAVNLKSLGMDHMNTERAYEELVDVAVLKGLKKDDAVSYGQNAKISIEHEDNGDEAMTKQKFDSAINDYKKALEIEESFLGDDHLVTEGLLRKIVECHKMSGKTDHSFQFYRKMIRIYMIYAPPDYDANYMLRNLETTVQDLGLSEAQKAEYIDIVKESVRCEINGDSAEKSKNYGSAIDSYSRCLLMEQSLLGMLHPSIWPVYKKIGSTFGKKGDIDSAIISHSKALAILEAYLGLKEKETIDTYNDLLNATLHKISSISDTRQVDSTQNENVITSPKTFFEKPAESKIKHINSAEGKDKTGDNDIYGVFASLRKGVAGDDINIEGDKMEILKGLAQRWHELDESRIIIDGNRLSSYTLQRNERNDPDKSFSLSKSLDAKNGSGKKTMVSSEGKSSSITPLIDSAQVPKGTGIMNEKMIHSTNAHSLKKSLSTKEQGGDSSLDRGFEKRSPLKTASHLFSGKGREIDATKELGGTSDIGKLNLGNKSSLSKNRVGGTQKKGIGNLIERFSKTTQQKSAPTNEQDRADALHWLKNKGAKNDKDNKFSVEKSTKAFEKHAFNTHIPEIPAFNSNRGSKRDTEIDFHGVSISSDSSSKSSFSMSSYESL